MKAVSTWAAAERAVVARARWRIGLIVALAVTGLVTAVGAICYTMLVHGQQQQIDRELLWNAQRGDPSGPPGCTWLFLYQDGVISTGLVPTPPGFPLRGPLDTVAASGGSATEVLDRNGTEYHVLTVPRGEAVVQVVFDARYQLADRRHLLQALLLAEALGLLCAVLAGFFVGRRAVAPLADALSRQRRFVADASHELRTPIAQVHTRAQLLARRASLSPEHRTDLDRLVGSTRMLGEVVDDLLLSAQLSAAPTHTVVDLAQLARDAVVLDTDRAAGLGVTLCLARPDGPLCVPGVPSALRRVVAELLSNALAHTPAGGTITLTVRRAAAPGPPQAELVVADTGDGFDSANAERLFDRFHRGAARPGERRFGLGLALLREVVTAHGGSIAAAGQPGAGATFTVLLPLAEAPAPRFTALPPSLRRVAFRRAG